jgi:hypothetical protein
MEWTFDCLEKDKIVCAKTSGLMDWEQHKKFAEELFSFAIKNDSHKVLVDFRDMVPDLSILQIDDLPKLLSDIGSGSRLKVAALYDESSPYSHENRFEFVKSVLALRSIKVQHFFD